eukprot:gene16487-19573_t
MWMGGAIKGGLQAGGSDVAMLPTSGHKQFNTAVEKGDLEGARVMLGAVSDSFFFLRTSNATRWFLGSLLQLGAVTLHCQNDARFAPMKKIGSVLKAAIQKANLSYANLESSKFVGDIRMLAKHSHVCNASVITPSDAGSGSKQAEELRHVLQKHKAC